ncbi:MAG: hypothetical protein IK099_03635 [Clostridia bacterium]|nr:hypothetical protein [Clostridia bacterium]
MKKAIAVLLCLLTLVANAWAFSEETPARLPDETLMSFYDQSVFAGDSTIRMFRNYVKERQEKEPSYFSGIRFYSAYSIQLRTLGLEWVNSELTNLTYKGSDEVLCEIVQRIKPEKVFILAGLNDNFAKEKNGEGIDRGMRYVGNIMKAINKHAPGTQVFFFSLTPVTQKVEDTRHIQALWDQYNERLEQTCLELGATYIDIASALKDENGLLPKSITSEGEYHLNAEGNAIWAQVLLDFAQAQYEAGLWSPVQ